MLNMTLDWTKSQFDWSEILDVDPSFRIVKIVYRLVRALTRTVISRQSREFVLQQVRPNGSKFYTRLVVRGFVFCTFLPNWVSRHFTVRCVRILYTNGPIDILVKGLAVNFRVEEFQEAEFVSEEAAERYYKLNIDTPQCVGGAGPDRKEGSIGTLLN